MRVSNESRPVVGLIGLGHMGTAMGERLLDAGYELVVYNRTPEKARTLAERGAAVAETAAGLAEQVDVVLTSLANDQALEAVATEVVSRARRGTILIDTSTVSVTVSANVALLATAASMPYLRAPVSGNPAAVRSGTLSFIVSGAHDTLARVEAVLRAIGPTIHHVGDSEEARVVKLSINLMIAGLAQLLSEALVLGEAAGVSRVSLLEAMGSSAAAAPFVKYKTQPLLRDDYSATFTTALMDKDVDLILVAAEEAGVELPLARQLKDLLVSAIDAGYADDDFMSLFVHLRSASRRAAGHLDQEVVR